MGNYLAFMAGAFYPRDPLVVIMKEITYLIYILLWDGMIFGGAFYVVFILNRSGWWFILAVIIGANAISKKKWMCDSRNPPEKSSEEKREHDTENTPKIQRPE